MVLVLGAHVRLEVRQGTVGELKERCQLLDWTFHSSQTLYDYQSLYLIIADVAYQQSVQVVGCTGRWEASISQ